MTTAVLKIAERTKSFILRTDASNYALSAVLLWISDKDFEHPIEYASRLLKVQKEIIPLQNARLWLLFGPCRRSGLRSLSERSTHRILQLQLFLFKIEYEPGKSNVMADKV